MTLNRTRLRRYRRLLSAGVSAVLVASATVGSASGSTLPPGVPPVQELAVLLTTHGAHQAPLAGSTQVASIGARRPITGERTTLPVIGRLTGPDSVGWLRVMLPGRPNGSVGWIAQQGTRRLLTSWHIVIALATRRVTAYRDGHVMRRFQAVVGKPATPTPIGRFFVEETLQMQAGDPGGPFALALSARSDALQEFEGGPGQIAIHGRNNLGGTLGTAASHGCVRIATAGIDWLAARIGPGTPVTIASG